ncbi:RNA-binding domain-containing protein [Panus rudis PR-1116 ss-1]|nr:RNA-binding domain-containing protein [Panus rudis PR-1116 ss-1]
MSDAPAAPVTENGVPPAAQETVVEETPGYKVFVGNLAYSTTDEGLKTFFEPVQSDILTAQVILRGTRSTGYGFVSLASAEAAQKAVELLNKKELDGREVIVEIAKPADQKSKDKKQRKPKRKPGRRGSKAVPGEVTEAEADGAEKPEGAAAPSGDEAAKPKKKKKNNASRKGKKRRAASGESPAASGAENTTAPEDAAAEGTAAPKKKTRKPRAPRPQRAPGEEPTGEPSKTVLFVANLGFSIDDAGLSALFTDAGIHVNSARIVRRRWGKPRRSKGYGFVDVGSEEEQKKAIELLQGKEVGGRPIAVKVAVDPQHEEGEADKAEEAATEAAPAELESRQEGLSRSLFERAKEEEGTGQKNKALAMMMKMGFKPGQSLGRTGDDPEPEANPRFKSPEIKDDNINHPAEASSQTQRHRIVPLALNEWAGKKGIGLGKRAASPSTPERLAKMAKMAEERTHQDFRGRARDEYEERRAEGRLVSAQRTCVTLDEKANREFNILWLNPNNTETFPDGLLDVLDDAVLAADTEWRKHDDSIEGRLRAKMQADALRPLSSNVEDDDSPEDKKDMRKAPYSEEDIQEAAQFLRLSAKDRLTLVLEYLRRRYAYCFWCGTEYENQEDLAENCPGSEEDDHD